MFKKSLTVFKINSTRMLSGQNPEKFASTIQEKKILEPLAYLQKVPSKHHRPMVPAFNHWLKVPRTKAEEIEEILQTLHSATLLLDDLQDDSAVRYGVPAAHRVFGVGLTVNAASTAMVAMGKKILELGHPLAPKIYVERLIEMHHGQGIDLYWSDHLVCPTEAAHIDMIKKKVASFFILLVQLLQLFSAREEDFTNLATNIALYYCILDDYCNLFHPKGLENLASIKQGYRDHISCSDITECKFTLAMIHAMQFADVTDELFDILKQRTSDTCLKKRFISLLKKHGSDVYTRDLLTSLEADIHSQIKGLGGNAMLTNLMVDLSSQVTESAQKSNLIIS